MQPLTALQPLWSLLLTAMLACQPNASRSDGATSPEARGEPEIARRDTATLSVQIIPLREPRATYLSLDRTGALTRLEGRNLMITHAGRTQVSRTDVAALFDLAARVPRTQRMGDGIADATIYRLAVGGSDTVAAFVEPLMPDELRRLLDRLGPILQRAELHANTDWYVTADPVTPSRRSRLASSGTNAIDPDNLSPTTRDVALAACAGPYVLRPVARAIADELTAQGAGREPFVALDETTWMQIGIWGPP
jgi:hypothetical protein